MVSAIMNIVNETLTQFFENQILEVMMYDCKYYLDGYDFIVDGVYIDEDGAIVAYGHYNDGVGDEAYVDQLEIVRTFKKEVV